MEELYGAFYITPEFTRSFKGCRTAGFLFGQDYKTGKLTISGSRSQYRGANDWLADYFGLPTDFKSTVMFKPRVSNFLVDLGLYLGLDEIVPGAYFRIHAPIVYSRWEMKVCENVSDPGTNDYDMGYMWTNTIKRSELPNKFSESAITGCFTWGDMQDSLKYTKITPSCCVRSKTRLSDIQVAIGWNFIQEEDRHLGFHILGGFPTGGKRCCEYMFAPVIGNGGHFELGAGLTSSSRLWMSDDEERSAWVYLDANLAHLFKRKLFRTFELKDKPNSRYMLVQEMKSTAENLYVVGTETELSEYQYNEKLLPLANISTCCTDVSVALQGEMSVKFAFNNGNWSLDLGYNLWGRTGEKVCKGCPIPEKKYALKGDALLYGWNSSDSSLRSALGATESEADIHAGTNTPITSPYVPWPSATDPKNSGVDSPALANYSIAGPALVYLQGVALETVTSVQTTLNGGHKFLSCDSLNTCKTPAALSHKVFGHINYAWTEDRDEDEWIPFLGLGGEVEFSGKVKDQYGALYQWGVWVKGGMAFD